MGSWIRFLHENGDSTLVNGDQCYFYFNTQQPQVEVFSAVATPATGTGPVPICVFACDDVEQVAAAEDMILQAATSNQPVTISLDTLDEQADYLNHISGLRMVLQLLHQGHIRIPIESEYSEHDLFDRDPEHRPSELSQFEEMLYTYLNVPADALRRAYEDKGDDAPFKLSQDHEECPDHGFHEYWVVAARPDRHYTIREHYNDLARTLIDKEGYALGADSHGHGAHGDHPPA